MGPEERRLRLTSMDSLVQRQSYELTVRRTQALKQQLYDRYNRCDRSDCETPDSEEKEIQVRIPPSQAKDLGAKELKFVETDLASPRRDILDQVNSLFSQ